MSLLDSIIVGVCNGFGTAIGAYFAARYAIKHLDDPQKKTTIKENIKKLREKIEGLWG